MWENITPADIEQARDNLNFRRAETLSRHAEEIDALEADQSELEQLVHIIEAFISKYKNRAETAADEGTSPAAANEVKDQDQMPGQPAQFRYQELGQGMSPNFG